MFWGPSNDLLPPCYQKSGDDSQLQLVVLHVDDDRFFAGSEDG